LVPVIVTVELPAGVAAAVEIVKVLLPEPEIEAGLKVPVAPLGRPLSVSAVAPFRPDVAATVSVTVPFVPAVRVKLVGELESVKPAA
jgi:hypothetical protein